MWSKNKPKYKKAIKLWNTRKPNGNRMYQKKEIVDLVGVDRKTLFRWLKGIV